MSTNPPKLPPRTNKVTLYEIKHYYKEKFKVSPKSEIRNIFLGSNKKKNFTDEEIEIIKIINENKKNLNLNIPQKMALSSIIALNPEIAIQTTEYK